MLHTKGKVNKIAEGDYALVFGSLRQMTNGQLVKCRLSGKSRALVSSYFDKHGTVESRAKLAEIIARDVCNVQ